jgi:hypothetical protein
MTKPTIVLALAVLATTACAPKKDTANPEGNKAACTEEAKQCADGSTVAREGPDCEFPACPGEGEGEAEPDPSKTEGEGEAEPAGDADETETPAEGE